MTQASDGANVRFPPPFIYVIVFGLGMVADRLLHLPDLGLTPRTGELCGTVFAFAGVLLSFAGAGTFLRRRTAIIPYKPASSLVTSGIYRWTRNPMYLGMALIYAGVALALDSLSALVLLPLAIGVVQTQVIAREEAYLQRAFGTEYVAYRSHVRPWI